LFHANAMLPTPDTLYSETTDENKM